MYGNMVIAMDKVKYNVIVAGLLHDTGKLILRSEPQRKNHSQAGAEFLARYISDFASGEVSSCLGAEAGKAGC